MKEILELKVNEIDKKENLKKIEFFKSMKKGWNCYDADPISLKVCKNAINFINHCVLQPKIFPVATNVIQCEYENDTTYLEFEIFEEYIKVYINLSNKNKNEDEHIHEKIKIDDYETINEFIKQYFKND